MSVSKGQFAIIPASVLYDDSLPATAKLLYGEIYRLSSEVGYCFATNKQFAQVVRCSDKNITRLVGALKDGGHIRVAMVRRNDVDGDIVQRRIFCGLELAKNDPGSSQKGIRKNAEGSPQNCLDGTPKTVHDTIYKDNKRNTPIVPTNLMARIQEYCDGNNHLEGAIVGLLENRQAVNKSKAVKTMRSLNGILNALDRHSGGDVAKKLVLLDRAITANWLTVYPLREGDFPSAPTDRPRVVEEQGVEYL